LNRKLLKRYFYDDEVDMDMVIMNTLATSGNKLRKLFCCGHPVSSSGDSRKSALKTNLRLYAVRYSRFIKSPRICFIYDTFFYLVFLLLFSYMLLCDFNYYDQELSKTTTATSLPNVTLISNNFTNYTRKRLLLNTFTVNPHVSHPSSLEWLLLLWIITYIIDEIRQVEEKCEIMTTSNHFWLSFLYFQSKAHFRRHKKDCQEKDTTLFFQFLEFLGRIRLLDVCNRVRAEICLNDDRRKLVYCFEVKF
jgi:hypothetical protein